MEKPILFSTEMVRAILEGRKSQTRRVIKPQPDGEIKANIPYEFYGTKTERIFTDTKAYLAPCSVGDILWVRETWAKDDTYYYKADGSCGSRCGKWKPSIHMPKEAARIWLEVTDVRVERLQEITEEDARAEGALPTREERGYNCCRDEFITLWDSINSKRGYGWDTNPWVWVIEFERIAA